MKKIKDESKTEKLLTDVELEFMNIIWNLKEASVTEVQANLDMTRPLAYTSISTILRILEQKEVLKTRKEGRGHIYIPLMTREDYEAKSIKNLVNKIFNGTPSALVKQLFNAVDVDQDELKEIKKLIAKMGN